MHGFQEHKSPLYFSAFLVGKAKSVTVYLCVLLSACGGGVKSAPVENFDVNRYLGDWHEIARTDNKFEKGCTNVTANYSLRSDGGIDVVNRCTVNGKEKIAKGRAYFKERSDIGSLKVTFFWPFYGNYNISYLDIDYQFSLVDGGSKKYLWILSRNKTMKKQDMEILLAKARENGFDTSQLIFST